jgi:hypothetical protein
LRPASSIRRTFAVPWLLLGMLAMATVWRAPSLPFQELNWDEALYRLMADSIVAGHLPGEVIWDRKPAGLFALLALLRGLAGGSAIGLRIAVGLAVGAGGWFLAAITGRLVPERRSAGALAGLLWIVHSRLNGGDGVNAELLFVPLNLAGGWVLLTARGRAGLAAAGLLLGCAFETKYDAAFAWPALVLLWWHLRPDCRTWRNLVSLAVGAALPAVLAPVIYALAGHFDLWMVENLAAAAAALSDTVERGDFAGIAFHLVPYAVPLIGTTLALAGGRWVIGPGWRAFIAVVAVWLAGEALDLTVLRRFADHMFIPLLPPLCLAAGVGFDGLAARLPARWRTAALGLALLGWAAAEGRAMARPFLAAAEISAHRHNGDVAWGDPVATAGLWLRHRLQPGEAVFVFGGGMLAIYEVAGRSPPTRFPFVEHLWKDDAPVDGVAEMTRILAGAPAYIAVAAGWAPGEPPPEPPAQKVFAALDTALARDYRLEVTIAPYVSTGGGPIGPRTAILLFRRVAR